MEVTPDQIEQVIASVENAMSDIEDQLKMWIGQVNGAIRDVRGDDPATVRKEVSEGLKELARTRQLLLSERDRHLEVLKKEAGCVDGTIIDFEAERTAIASKLDRLRHVYETESVSG